MRHRKKSTTLGREKGPREALLRNLATSFILYERIETTTAKAKFMRPIVERLITLAKEDTIHHRRQALKKVYVESAVRKLFEVLGPRFKERPGGYTRITKLSRRVGDGAEMSVIELVERT